MKSEVISGVLVSVLTAVVLGIGAYFMGVFEKGTQAINADEIRVVLEGELVTDSGKTYKARLAEVDRELVKLETRMQNLRDDVEDLEDIALDLAGGN